MKEAVEVANQVQLEQKETEYSSGSAEDVEQQEKTREVSKERIERMKRAFRPSWLQDIIDTPDKGNRKKK